MWRGIVKYTNQSPETELKTAVLVDKMLKRSFFFLYHQENIPKQCLYIEKPPCFLRIQQNFFNLFYRSR